ncbi:MAG: VWA domain-containing protein [Robiginitomaculum sp.]|nr:VWA domain-containing protein [Robiginitomaculum sp.]
MQKFKLLGMMLVFGITACAGDNTEMASPKPQQKPEADKSNIAVSASRVHLGTISNRVANFAVPRPLPIIDRDRYSTEPSNPIKLVSEQPVSTFSIDVDTASYANARRFLNDGVLPPSNAVRVEEFINYFDYQYPITSNKQQPFSTNISLTPSPWNSGTQLLHIGIKGYDIKPDKRPAANLVLLFDVSGSMRGKDRLPLAIKAMKLLVDQMNNKDRVAIVVYAGAAGMVLSPTTGDNKQAIYAALENLKAGGSTAGGEGLRLAYSLAEQNFDDNAVNRVILATDGDFNVGVVSGERLEDFVTRKRDSGIYLSVMGFGRGNYNDQMMQKIAQAGNGNAAYIGTLNEARKVLVEEMHGALFTIAEDVKIQVEFNPQRVAEYRLIGYETRMLKREDFANDKVDAAEIGSGHTVTAIYEITAPDSKSRMIEDLRYGSKDKSVVKLSDEIAHVRIRYKLPKQDQSRLIEQAITDADKVDKLNQAPKYVQFSTAVAGFAQILRSETRLQDFGFDQVIALAQESKGADEFGYRAEFISLVRLAKIAATQETLEIKQKNTD